MSDNRDETENVTLSSWQKRGLSTLSAALATALRGSIADQPREKESILPKRFDVRVKDTKSSI